MFLACHESIRSRRRLKVLKDSNTAAASGTIGRVIDKDTVPYFKRSPVKRFRRKSAITANKCIVKRCLANGCRPVSFVQLIAPGYDSDDATVSSCKFKIWIEGN